MSMSVIGGIIQKGRNGVDEERVSKGVGKPPSNERMTGEKRRKERGWAKNVGMKGEEVGLVPIIRHTSQAQSPDRPRRSQQGWAKTLWDS